MKKPYRDSVSTICIIEDGWARGFRILQTYQELNQMGRNVDIEKIQDVWDSFDNAYSYSDKGEEAMASILHKAALLDW